MWQLRATRASSQSSRKRDASPVLPNDFKSTNYIIMLIHLVTRCTLTLGPNVYVAAPIRAFRAAVPPHVSQVRGNAAERAASFCGSHMQTNQCTSRQRLGSNSRPEFHRICESERLLLDEEKEGLAVRPILPWNIPDAACRAKTHNIPRIQKRPDSLPVGSFPHLLQNLCTSQAGRCSHRPKGKERNCVTRACDLRPNL